MFTQQLVVMFVGGLLAPLAHAAAPVAVSARLYNTAQVPADARDAAVVVATRAMQEGGIRVGWQNCDRAGACARVPARGELIIRLVRSGDVAPAAGRTYSGPPFRAYSGQPFALGEASIDTGTGAGVLATIYVDRVERMAVLSETDAIVLLGRAIAHELGHLLMATNAHSASGLMRAQWTTADLRRNQMADWVLQKEDAAAIRQRLR